MQRLLPPPFFFPVCVACRTEESREIDVMTFNIRYDNPRDSINAWPNRAAMVAGFINDQVPDLLGMQEVLWHQYEYLDSALTGYGSFAAGRDDGIRGGEACPVFYRLGRFSPVDHGTFWLSATPGVPGSVGWGAALTRITTWVRLYDRTAKRHPGLFQYSLRPYKRLCPGDELRGAAGEGERAGRRQ